MIRSIPAIDRALEFFRLPSCYIQAVRFPGMTKSRWGVACDLVRLFYSYRTFPDHYVPCRLFEIPRADWRYYYGSNYQSYQRARLLREVQPQVYAILFEDKILCEWLCKSAHVNLPHTYGLVRPHQDYREYIRCWVNESPAHAVMVKPLRGAGGRGVVRAEEAGGDYPQGAWGSVDVG